MSKFGFILACICILDLIVTILGIKLGYFNEFNPLLRWYLNHWSLSGLIAIKIFLTVAPIFILELAQNKKAYKCAIFVYIFIYIGCILYQIQ